MLSCTAWTAGSGTLEQGSDQVELSSTGVGPYVVGFPARGGNDADGTTCPEELVAAARSSCYAERAPGSDTPDTSEEFA